MGVIQCLRCKNFDFSKIDFGSDKWRCKAFPNGIPKEKIMNLYFDDCKNCNNGIGLVNLTEEDYKNM